MCNHLSVMTLPDSLSCVTLVVIELWCIETSAEGNLQLQQRNCFLTKSTHVIMITTKHGAENVGRKKKKPVQIVAVASK